MFSGWPGAAAAFLACILLWCANAASDSATAAAAEKRALLIGINDYLANDSDSLPDSEDTWVPEDLRGAINDIDLMEEVLTSRFGFEAKHIQRLENRRATREAMLTALRDFVSATGPDDIVYIHFSGHGSQVEDRNGDEEDGFDETILPHDARSGATPDITDDELQQIFARLATPNSLIVLDSCHSGTATRSSSALRVRSTPLDTRSGLYDGLPRDAGGDSSRNYILMTGAAAYQSALDGPLEEGRHYGLFTLSLGRSLGRIRSGATARELHEAVTEEMERIGAQFGLYAVPDSQLEGETNRLQSGILGESRALATRNAARLPWLRIASAAAGAMQMDDARSLAAQVGSLWGVYPAGETRFLPGEATATVRVLALEGDDALVELAEGIPPEPGSRAVRFLEPPPDDRVAMRLDRMSDSDRMRLAAAVGRTDAESRLRLVEAGEFARFIVDREDDAFVVYGAGGLQRVAEVPATDLRAVAEKLSALARRAWNVSTLLALDNAGSELRVSARVNPVDAAGRVRGVAVTGAAQAPAFRLKRADETRDRSNSLQLEITVTRESFLTIVDIDPEGAVAMLFPNSLSERNAFYPDGRIPGATAIRIPDALGENRAGFNWDLVPPTGIDTIRVFAAEDLETARKIRAYVSQLASTVRQRGSGLGIPERSDFFPLRSGPATRGIDVAGGESGSRGDWTATTVNVVIED